MKNSWPFNYSGKSQNSWGRDKRTLKKFGNKSNKHPETHFSTSQVKLQQGSYRTSYRKWA